jgi:uncharacterized alpha/beta hydrolase family protein
MPEFKQKIKVSKNSQNIIIAFLFTIFQNTQSLTKKNKSLKELLSELASLKRERTVRFTQL